MRCDIARNAVVARRRPNPWPLDREFTNLKEAAASIELAGAVTALAGCDDTIYSSEKSAHSLVIPSIAQLRAHVLTTVFSNILHRGHVLISRRPVRSERSLVVALNSERLCDSLARALSPAQSLRDRARYWRRSKQ